MNSIPKGLDAVEQKLLREIISSTPKDKDGVIIHTSTGTESGPDISKQFLDRNNLDRIIRGHTSVEDRFANDHDGRLTTILSAPTKGKSIYVNIDSRLNVHVEHFTAYPKLRPIEI